MNHLIERYLAPAFLLCCLGLGGASSAGLVANAGLQLLSIGLIVALVLGGSLPALPRPARMLLSLVALAAALMLLQLIPLPPAVWSAIPGRGEVARAFALAKIDAPWLPISLAPNGTIAALLGLLPPLAMILAIYASSGYGRVYAAYVLALFAIGSMCIGIIQKADGNDSPLYLYEITNFGGAVGLFANRNHLATMLLAAMPFVAALTVSPSKRGDKDVKIGRRLLGACVVAFLTVGVIYIKSVAGWLLLFPALVLSTLIFQRGERGKSSIALIQGSVVVMAIGVGLAIFAPISVNDLGDKLSGIGPQQRNTIIANVLHAAVDYLPTGSGGGSFPYIYPSYEDPEAASGEFINHSHSDYAEVLLEYGVLGGALLIAALAFWISRFPALWRSNSPEGGLGRAGFVAIGIVAGHSLVDYPIRTAAIAAIVGMAAALMVAPDTTEAPTFHVRRRGRRKSTRTITLEAAEEPARLSEADVPRRD